jgi:HD-like signal output (HDOD) protein/signal transduction histidine kinase
MPQILLRFYEEADSDTASVDKLAELVLQDPALSARILTVANSAAFRRGSELRSIRESLLALGTRMVRTIASCVLVQSTFQRMPGSEARDLAGFWRHSLLVAELARGTAFALGASDLEAEEAYLAGLLHDVGQLLLLGGLGDSYGSILSDAPGEAELSDMERAVLSTDHGAVGAWLVDQWSLPSLMADAILFHHLDPSRVGGLDRLGRILWSAHVMSVSPEASPVELDVIERLLGFDAARFRELRDEASQRVDALAVALGPDVARAAPTQTLPRVTRSPRAEGEEAPTTNGHDATLQATVSTLAALQTLPRDIAGLDSDVDLMHCVRESARILFGIQRMAFFLVEPDQSLMSAVGLGVPSGALQRLEIPLQAGMSLCADAALSRRPITTFDFDGAQPLPPPMDQQIAHALGAEGLLYLPMLAHGALVGVMALAVSTVQRAHLTAHTGRLWDFASIVTGNLMTWRRIREREQQIEAEVSARFVLEGRRVAHEVNNPLAIIRNYLTLISNDAGKGERAQGDLDVLREEIDRLSAIVRDLTVDPSKTDEPPGTVDLNRLLESLRTLYEPSLFGDTGVRLELHLPGEHAFASADRDNVKQIVFNLWKNAVEAMRSGGTVLTEVTPHVNQNGARYVQLRIRDSGPGLPAPVLESLYRPLDSRTHPARPAGRAGLGLSIVLGLVERNGGFIACQSQPGDGTTFTLLIPESRRTDR